MSKNVTRGMLFIHSLPQALCSHAQWALADILEQSIAFEWINQPVASGSVRTEWSFMGEAGVSSRIASILVGFPHIRFEVTEEPSPGVDGQRIMCTPSLGLWRSALGVHGENLINEDRLRSMVVTAMHNGESIADAVEHVLGGPWDLELEPFRYAGEGMTVRWLHQTG